MTILLESNYGGQRQNLVVRPGQTAKIGRSEWADLSIDQDSCLADEHFVVAYDSVPTVRALPAADLEVQGENTNDIEVVDGLVFQAGTTTFSLRISDACKTQSKVDSEAQATDAAQEENHLFKLPYSLLQKLKLTSSFREQNTSESCFVISDCLDASESIQDLCNCTKLIASLFSKSSAVAIVKMYLALVGRPLSSTAAKVIEDWRLANIDDSRGEVAKLVQDCTDRDHEYWCLRAVEWSGGSLGPPEHEVVPPPEHLFPLSLAVAVQLSIIKSTTTFQRAKEKFTAAANQFLSEVELTSLVSVAETTGKTRPKLELEENASGENS